MTPEEQAMAALFGGGHFAEELAGPRPLHEAQIDELRKAEAVYAAATERFQRGDIVQAKKNSYYKNPGEPCVVAEVRDAEPFFGDDPTAAGGQSFGGRNDMRVFVVDDHGNIVAHWVESWCFEPYDGSGLIGDTNTSPDAPAN